MNRIDLRDMRHKNLLCLIKEKFSGHQAEFAAAAKRNPTQVNHWISGHRNPNGDTCRDVELKLGYPMGWLDLDHSDETGEASGAETPPPTQSTEIAPNYKQKSTVAHTEQAQAATNNIANISERRSGGSVESALRILADAIRPLNTNERDNIASQLRSFGRDPDSQMVLNGLLACLNSANASSQAEAPAQFYSSGGV